MKTKAVLAHTVSRVILTLTMLGAPSLFAHEGHDHGTEESSLKGTIESLNGNKLTLKSTDGKSVGIHVDDQTRYDNGEAGGSASDLRPGMRVVVNGEKMKDGTVHAATIRYVKSKPKATTHHDHKQAGTTE